jgi:hypothetical protein
VKLNDPQLVRDEYASEAGLEARRSIYAGPLRATRRVSIFVARR